MEETLKKIVDSRKEKGLLRNLTLSEGLIDFSSNDYLGLARSSLFHDLFMKKLKSFESKSIIGSTGSRLLSGNSLFAEDLERDIARFHESPSALLFNSGFDANMGFFGCVPQPDDIVFYDELIHASVHEGLKVARSKKQSFKHNDTKDLEDKIIKIRKEGKVKNILVSVETVYSMDGDVAPLFEIVATCEKYQANLIVDEAHATGIMGPKGSGLVQQLGLQRKVFARLHTFGKALGCHGAVILGSETLRTYLINYCRPLIYSTSLGLHSLVAIQCSYQMIQSKESIEQVNYLNDMICRFKKNLSSLPSERVLPSSTPIQGVIVPGNTQVVLVSQKLKEAGFDVKPIRSPTVPAGLERLRICIHAHNTIQQIDNLCNLIISVISPSLHSSSRL